MVFGSHSIFMTAGKTVTLLLLMCDVTAIDHLDDPEPEVTWTTPKDPSDYQSFNIGANYSGLLFAGSVEFNWIVDIRVADQDQEKWATGNLVSYLHVLTTCRAADLLALDAGDGRDKVQDPDTKWNVDVYRNTPTNLRINYCENYLWSDGAFTGRDEDKMATGSKSVKKVIVHPKCGTHQLLYDAAVIVLWTPLPAIEPRIGYMPTGFDYVNEVTKQMVTLDPAAKITYQSPLCYVASFGRNYVNHKEFYVLDYKVKFRVYITKWDDCTNMWDIVCGKFPACKDANSKNDPKLMCFRPRAKVGTVCDHDRGAPLVCNGQVIGLVIRGADFRHCNNLYKIPFIVEPIDRYRQFFDLAVKYVVRPVKRKGAKAVTPHARASLNVAFEPLYFSSLAFIHLTRAAP